MSKLMDRIRRKEDDEASDEALLEQIAGYPHLKALKPKEKMVFRSDYVEIDNDYVTTILDFFHSAESTDSFPPFWGANLIPKGLDEMGVTTILFEQTRRMTDEWIDKHQSQSDRLGRMSEREQSSTNTTKGKQKVQKLETDRQIIFRELQAGGAYLNVHFSLLVKAPNIDTLDLAVDSISRQYVSGNMSNVKVGVYEGEQRNSFAKLFALNKKKRNKGAYFTSQEYAGAYSLLTNGFDDPEGEFIGSMLGDFNPSANIFDVDNYRERVVVAHPKRLRALGNAYYSDAWASKMSQAALLNNHKVVHLVLSESTNLDLLGPKFEDITRRIDMRTGEINMFEIFGDVEDQLSLFGRNIEKIKLMTDQLFAGDQNTKALALGYLTDVLEEFYIEKGMWVENAAENQDDVRLIGIPHNKVPRLRLFRDYIYQRYEQSKQEGDTQMTTAFNLLNTTYSKMLTTDGDLFDQITTSTVDTVRGGRRVIYDFSGLIHRGKGTAMAQLINVVSFAVSTLNEGDVVIINGADNIVNAHDFQSNTLGKNEIKQYIEKELNDLIRRGGRVVYTYEKIDAMLRDREFNRFDEATYTVLGTMSSNMVNEYEEALGKRIPPLVKGIISNEEANTCFIRRGMQNVPFKLDLALGFNSERTAMAAREISQPTPGQPGQGAYGQPRGSFSSAQETEVKWSTAAAKRAEAREKKTLRRKKAQKRKFSSISSSLDTTGINKSTTSTHESSRTTKTKDGE